MMQRERREWTFRSVLTAIGLAIAGMMITLQLVQWHVWPDDWSALVVPAIIASIFFALRHPGTNLLTALVFFPLVVTLMFYAGACFPLGPTQ